MQRFLRNIFATGCCSLMGVSPLVLELKLWHLIFLHLMTFLVTLTCGSTLLLKILAFLGQFEYIFTTTITKRSILIRLEAWMFCIGSNGHVPGEYQPDETKKNWFHPDLTIPVWIPPAKLQNSGVSTLREIYRNPLHINSEPTVVHESMIKKTHGLVKEPGADFGFGFCWFGYQILFMGC